MKQRVSPGVQRIHESATTPGRPANVVTMISPLPEEYRLYKEGEAANCLSSVFLIETAGKRLLLGTHALVKRWKHVIKQARDAKVEFKADAFLVPHFASNVSLDKTVIRAVVNPSGFTAILPTSEMFRRPKFQIPDENVLASLREAGGELIVAGNEPIHFLLNADGLFRAASGS